HAVASSNQKTRQRAARAASVSSTLSTHWYSAVLGSAPILVAATWPFLNSIKVGMPRTPYFDGTIGFSSILILATVSLPCISPDICSRIGPIALHGPHHSAQKSSSTGPSALSTWESNVSSVT